MKSTMKLFTCCLLLLPFTTMVLTVPIRAQRENVLIFLSDALSTMTTPVIETAANKNPQSEIVSDRASQDMTDATSAESFETIGFTDVAKDLESHEIRIMIPKEDKDSVGMIRRLVQDYQSRDVTDLDSEEGTTMDPQQDGKQHVRLSEIKMNDRPGESENLQRIAGRVNGSNSKLITGQSLETQDWDSLEQNAGKVAAVGNIRDYDETRENISSEIYPVAPAINNPSQFSAPGRTQAS